MRINYQYNKDLNNSFYKIQGDFFGAGVDTSITTLKFVLVYLACKRKTVQKEIYEEISMVMKKVILLLNYKYYGLSRLQCVIMLLIIIAFCFR